jgi:competence protein ComGC
MKNSKKITLILIASLSLMMVVAACSSKRGNNNNKTNEQANNVAKVQALYQKALNPLVADGTITKNQSDKVLETVTNKNNGTTNQNNTSNETNNGTTSSNTLGNGINNPPQGNNSMITPDQTNKEVGPGSGTGTDTGMSTGTGTGPETATVKKDSKANTTEPENDLSGLVANGTITQAQADIINRKIIEAMKNDEAK